MPDHLIHELKKWKLASPVNDYEVIFPSPERRITCHDNAVKGHFNRALRKAGLRHMSFHSLRHTNASLRIAGCQNIKYIQVQMGHSSIKVTLDVYGHLLNDINFNRQQVGVFESFLESLKSDKSGLPKISV